MAVALVIVSAVAVVAALALLARVRMLARSARASDLARDEAMNVAAAARGERDARDAILSGLEEGVVLFDPDGSVVFQNQRAGRLLGSPAERARRLAPQSLRDLVDSARGHAEPRVADVMGPKGRSLRATAASVGGDRVLLMLHDVTQARMLEAVRRDFVANASHELKTPAASIRAIAETMGSAALDDPEAIARFAAQMEQEAVRLSRIISDLLDLSRLEGETAQRTEVRFDRLVADEAERHRGAAEAGGLALDVRSDGPTIVRGSARDLSLMIRNLVQNAVQYTRPGGRIDVRVAAEDGDAVLTISDSGIGIPTRDQRRIFERFYRVDRARSRETGGTGLGLSIVKHVVENQGGKITVRSELGQGSTFMVRLPLSR